MEGKIAVLGDADFVMPFAALGLDTYPVGAERQQIVETAGKIVDADYAMLVVAENIAEAANDVLLEAEGRPTPCVVVVPFTTESEGFATEALSTILKFATGIDILKN